MQPSSETNMALAKHVFLQALMARKYMSETEARQLFSRVMSTGADDDFDKFWGSLHKELDFVGFGIRRVHVKGDGATYLGFVNLHNDEHSQLATHLSEPQLAYSRALFEEIKESEEQSLSAIECLNLKVRQASNTQLEEPEELGLTQIVSDMSSGAKETVLNLLVDEGWLYSKSGQIGLGPRAHLELHSIFES